MREVFDMLSEELLKQMDIEMKKASSELNFEKAAELKIKIK